MVREFDPPGTHPRRLLVLFHSHGADGALIRPDRFERAISLLWGALSWIQSRGLEVEWMADFDEWIPHRIDDRRDLGRTGIQLAGVRRARGTERHELLARLDEIPEETMVVIVSDMPARGWVDEIGPASRRIVVDVAKYEARGSNRDDG